MGTKNTAHYDQVIAEVFQRLKQRYGELEAYPFEKDLLERVTSDLVACGRISPIRNIPDIKYTYDARRDFPPQISANGYWAITGRGKGKYTFERIARNNLIRVPGDLSEFRVEEVHLTDQTPAEVAEVLGEDEQATMTRLRYNDILSNFFGFRTHQVQGHERTNLTCGQIEVDEVYVGSQGERKFVIPISAKGGSKDCLSYTQALNLSVYALEKKPYAGYIGRPLGVLKHPNGAFFVVEFNCTRAIHDIRIQRVGAYRFTD